MRLAFVILSFLLLIRPSASAEERLERTSPNMKPKEIAKFLKGEAKQARNLLKGSEYVAAHKELVSAAQFVIENTGKDSAIAEWLEGVLRDSAVKNAPKDSAAFLLAGVEKAAKAAEFEPDEQAPLPKGFPPPGLPEIIQVKTYPKSRMVIRRREPGSEAGENSLFMPLFRHIQRNNIPMTAPVETVRSAADPNHPDILSMSFFYPEPTTGKAGSEQDVAVEDVQPVQVVSIGVVGAYSEQNFVKPLGELRSWLARHSDEYTTAGQPRRLSYNSPFVLWFKKFSEVQIPVKPRISGESSPNAERTGASSLPDGRGPKDLTTPPKQN